MDDVRIFSRLFFLRERLQDSHQEYRYRYQLEAFVDKVKGRTPQAWVTPEDSFENMRAIEAVYDAVSWTDASPELLHLIRDVCYAVWPGSSSSVIVSWP